jgi:hypothetical protein
VSGHDCSDIGEGSFTEENDLEECTEQELTLILTRASGTPFGFRFEGGTKSVSQGIIKVESSHSLV